MPRDYGETIRALRAKAADKAVEEKERTILLAKARELEDKYGNSSSRPADNTTTTNAEETVFDWLNGFGGPAQTVPPSAQAWEEVLRLWANQYKWNDKYYDRNGNPRHTQADVDDMYEEAYKYDERDYDQIEEDY